MDFMLNLSHTTFSIVLVVLNLFVFGVNTQSLFFAAIILMPLLSQLISRKKKTNFLYPMFIIKHPEFVIVLLFILGTTPIVLELIYTRTFPISVALCNTLGTPLLVYSFLKYLQRMDGQTKFISELYASNHDMVIRLTEVVSQLVFLHLVLYNRGDFEGISSSPASVMNLFYQYIMLNLVVLTILYMVFAIYQAKKAEYRLTYPLYPAMAFMLFFICWGTRAFFQGEPPVEFIFYAACVIYALGLGIFTVILINMYYRAGNDTNRHLVSSSIILFINSITLIFYCWLVYNMSEEKKARELLQPSSSPENLLGIIIVLCLVAMFLVLLVVFNLRERKNETASVSVGQ